MENLTVLIVGAGVSGAVAAYWLGKAGAQVTVVERAPAMRTSGQGIDITGPAREIVDRMGVLDEMKARSTGEAGFSMVDDDGKMIAAVSGLLTQEIEVMRSDMVEILCNAADRLDNVTFQYGRRVTSLLETSNAVKVTFDSGEQAEFKAVIGADGLRSKTRELAFDKDIASAALKPLDVYIAYFELPWRAEDSPYSRLQTSTGGRGIAVRPVSKTKSSAYVSVADKSDRLERACHENQQTQKEALRDLLSDITGIGPRVLNEMMTSKDFYFERLAQVKMSKWSNGRVALCGDSACAPSPLTGCGVLLAITTAFVLAGELSENPEDPGAAFEAFEAKTRSYVEMKQRIPINPRLVNPLTWWGVWILRFVFRIICWTGLWRLISTKEDPFPLEAYPKMKGE